MCATSPGARGNHVLTAEEAARLLVVFAVGLDKFQTDKHNMPIASRAEAVASARVVFLETAQNFRPLPSFALFLQALLQGAPEQQRQETAKHMTPNRLVPLVIDGSGLQNRLHGAEHVLHLP